MDALAASSAQCCNFASSYFHRKQKPCVWVLHMRRFSCASPVRVTHVRLVQASSGLSRQVLLQSRVTCFASNLRHETALHKHLKYRREKVTLYTLVFGYLVLNVFFSYLDFAPKLRSESADTAKERMKSVSWGRMAKEKDSLQEYFRFV